MVKYDYIYKDNSILRLLMKRLSLFIISLLLITACQEKPLAIDVESVVVPELKVQRLENELFSLNKSNVSPLTDSIYAQYGEVYNHYVMSFLHRNGIKDTGYQQAILSYVQDRDVRQAYQYVNKLYSADRMKRLEADVVEMIKRFKYHFPNKKLPKQLITCTTGWNYAFAYMDSTFILGLDMYLGDTCMFYKMLQYPQYQTRKMNEAHILTDIARGWLLTEFDNKQAENNLLGYTIFYGKLFYAIEALLPNEADSVIIGYNTTQMQYLKNYEKNLWSYFAAKNRLFETSLNTVRELTTEGPFTAAISRDCPPRIAMWVGWQIVRSYMKKHPEVTLSDLMAEEDSKKILSLSKYRP